MGDKCTTKGDNSNIINNSILNFDMQIKHKSVIERKNNIYIPLIEDLNDSFKFINGPLFSKLEFPFIKKVLDKQYLYRLDDKLLEQMVDFCNLVDKFNKFNLIYVASNLIEKSFREGFNKLYGNHIIDGTRPIYDNEGSLVDYEELEPEEFEIIGCISSDKSSIIKLINNPDYDLYDMCYYDGDIDYTVNPYLARFYEFALAKRNKKNSPVRTQIINWNGKPEDYIAHTYDFFRDFYNNSEVKEKEKLLLDIESYRTNLLNELDHILKYIYITYEKE